MIYLSIYLSTYNQRWLSSYKNHSHNITLQHIHMILIGFIIVCQYLTNDHLQVVLKIILGCLQVLGGTC